MQDNQTELEPTAAANDTACSCPSARELAVTRFQQARAFAAAKVNQIRKAATEQEFDVEIKEVLSRVQKVKAESLDDAINKAMDMYYAEQIVLGAEDMKGVDFAPISEGQLPSSLKENGGRTR